MKWKSTPNTMDNKDLERFGVTNISGNYRDRGEVKAEYQNIDQQKMAQQETHNPYYHIVPCKRGESLCVTRR